MAATIPIPDEMVEALVDAVAERLWVWLEPRIVAVVEGTARRVAEAVAPPPAPLTVEEAARRAGVSVRTLRRWIAASKIPVVRIGRSVRVDPRVVEPTTIAQLARRAQAGLPLPWQKERRNR